ITDHAPHPDLDRDRSHDNRNPPVCAPRGGGRVYDCNAGSASLLFSGRHSGAGSGFAGGGGGGRGSAVPQGGVPNAGPSLGRQAIHATVPGAYYADQGYRLWDEGRYGWSIASHAASFVEAGLGVATLGWSTRYLA